MHELGNNSISKLYKNQRLLATLSPCMSEQTLPRTTTTKIKQLSRGEGEWGGKGLLAHDMYKLNSSVFVGCPAGSDSRWNITWASTALNTTDTQQCPGVNTRGTGSRTYFNLMLRLKELS